MENQKKQKNLFLFLSNFGIFCLELGKNILFGIGNGAEFRPQNRVIESPEIWRLCNRKYFVAYSKNLSVVVLAF